MGESGKRKLKFGAGSLSKGGREALGSLGEIRWGMSADSILKAVEALKAECGGDVSIEVRYDEHCGNETDARWSRQETDDEHAARLAENAERRRQKLLANKLARAAKKAAELETLATLKAKYPNA